MDVHYVDTSAMVKLIRSEPETAALVAWLADRHWLVSDLHRAELRRAAQRSGPRAAARAERVLAEVEMLVVDGTVFDRAGRLAPTGLRSLDAIHLAAAQMLGDDLAGIVTYDERLADAAAHHEIPTASPVDGPG